MKKIYLFSLLIISFIVMSCGENFLSTEDLTSKNSANYYSTPEEAYEALVGCYDGLQLIWSDGVAMNVASDIFSDLCFAGTGSGDDDNWVILDEVDPTVDPSYTNIFEGNWTYYYTGIFRCNALIKNIDQVEWSGDTTLRNEYLAETRFLRAFYYFDMVRMFERVPLLTEPSEDNIPQSEPDETYAVIVDDLLYAIAHCSDDTYAQIASTDYGHATKWSAEALMARVYLYYTGYYQKSDLLGEVTQDDALGYLEDIIANSGYSLVDNFYNLWPAAATYKAVLDGGTLDDTQYAGEGNQEVLFSIKYTYTSDYDGNVDAANWIRMLGLRNTSVAEYGYGKGWGGCTVPVEVYSDWDSNDDRRAASIMAIEEEGILDLVDYDGSGNKEYTGYYPKKYLCTCDAEGNSVAVNLGGPEWQYGQFQDYFSMRYADVLLMAAELGSDNALDYFNQVHTRAGLSEVSSIDKDAIFDERRLEFAFEGIWYWDMLRYDGKDNLDYIANKITYSGTVLRGGAENEKIITGANIKNTYGLFQIPNNQITLSDGVLIQNPGWD